jgi:excisionase family DNA binding protein
MTDPRISRTSVGADDRKGSAPMPPIAVRIPAAVQLTGISRSRLYELIRDKEIETVKLGSSTLVIVDSLHRLIDRLRAAQ